MSLLIPQPERLLQNLREIHELGADGPSRRKLAKNMFQANLKRTHHGWSSFANRLMGTTQVDVTLNFASDLPFTYRPGTTDLLVLEQVFLDGEYRVEPIAADSIEYIVDLGSNIGVTAMFWAQRYPKARMILVEPDPDNFKLLERNTAAFKDRCQLFNVAVSDQRGTTTFFHSDREYGHSLVRGDDSVSETVVRTLTVTDLIEEAGFPRVDLLKMDIEGGETIIMPTIASWKYAPRYLIAELHPPYDFDTFTEHCRKVGLKAVESGPEFRVNLPFAARSEGRTEARV